VAVNICNTMSSMFHIHSSSKLHSHGVQCYIHTRQTGSTLWSFA
jgi:hypothetical protein